MVVSSLYETMFERFTEQARQVVVLAQEEARSLRHYYIGTEHLLLGLLREEGGLAARALRGLDIHDERVRAEVVRIVGPREEVTSGRFPFTPRAKKVLELALREALSLGHNYIGTEHLLLGLARENDGIAARILLDFDADWEKIRNEVIRMLAAAPRPEARPRGGRVRILPPSGGAERFAEIGAAAWRAEVSASLATIFEALGAGATPSAQIPRRRARRLAEDAIRRHDPQAETTLGPQAWETMIVEILDANPDVQVSDA